MKCFTRIMLLAILLPTMSFGEDKLKHEVHENASGVEMLSSESITRQATRRRRRGFLLRYIFSLNWKNT